MDLKMVESGNGGDLVLVGNDLAKINGFQNMPYLAMFGGNPEQSTTGPKIGDEQAFDWWGNQLLIPNQQIIQFNSLLEKKLSEVALSSNGRQQIEQAVRRDISFINSFATTSVSVSIASAERIDINITIQEPNNKQSTEFVYIWDSTKSELIQQ